MIKRTEYQSEEFTNSVFILMVAENNEHKQKIFFTSLALIRKYWLFERSLPLSKRNFLDILIALAT